MATGGGLGGLVTALLPLLGIATILKARRRRKSGQPEPVDEDLERRKAATQESERRMRAYLAQHRPDSYVADMDDEQEKTQ